RLEPWPPLREGSLPRERVHRHRRRRDREGHVVAAERSRRLRGPGGRRRLHPDSGPDGVVAGPPAPGRRRPWPGRPVERAACRAQGGGGPMSRVVVRSQAELDEALARTDLTYADDEIVIDSPRGEWLVV